MSKIKWLLSILLLSVFSLAAVAADDKATTMKRFKNLDVDGDGFISRSEATSRADLRQRWNEVDADNDGKLTVAEFAAFDKVPREPFPE